MNGHNPKGCAFPPESARARGKVTSNQASERALPTPWMRAGPPGQGCEGGGSRQLAAQQSSNFQHSTESRSEKRAGSDAGANNSREYENDTASPSHKANTF